MFHGVVEKQQTRTCLGTPERQQASDKQKLSLLSPSEGQFAEAEAELVRESGVSPSLQHYQEDGSLCKRCKRVHVC